MKPLLNRTSPPVVRTDPTLDRYRRAVDGHNAKMEKQARAARGSAPGSADIAAPRQGNGQPVVPYEALLREARPGENVRLPHSIGSKPHSFAASLLCLSALLSLPREAGAAPAFGSFGPEEWVPPSHPAHPGDSGSIFKDNVFSEESAFLFKMRKQEERATYMSYPQLWYRGSAKYDKEFYIVDGGIRNAGGLGFQDLAESDYMRIQADEFGIPNAEVDRLLREVLERNKISTAFTFGSEENAIASVLLSRTGKNYGEKDLHKIQEAFKQLVSDWRHGGAGGEDPCRDAAKRIAATRGSKTPGFVNDMAMLLRAKYSDPQTRDTTGIALPEASETGRGTLSRDPIIAFEREVVDKAVDRPDAKKLDKLIDEQTRSFELDPLAQVLRGVVGLTFEDIADSYFMKAQYPDLDRDALRARLELWAHDKGIDTSFPMGSAVHAIATLVNRMTGNEDLPTQVDDAVNAFYKLDEQFPLEECALRAARYLETEKGWPELEVDDPTAIKNEKIQALMDQLRLETANPPALFDETEVAINALQERTGLSREELTLKGATADAAARAKIFYPAQGYASTQKHVESSVLDRFLEASSSGSDNTYAYNEEKQREMRLSGTAYTSKIITVKDKDGRPVELKPFGIMEEARKQFTEKLASDPWVDACARFVVREEARPKGMLPDKDAIARKKDKIIKELRPKYEHEKTMATLRSRIVNLGLLGQILNLVYLLGDAVEGDWESLTYNVPILGNFRYYHDAGQHFVDGEIWEGLDAALTGTPAVGGPYQAGRLLAEGKPVDAIFRLAGVGPLKTGGGKGLRASQVATWIKGPVPKARTFAKSVNLNPGPGKPSKPAEAQREAGPTIDSADDIDPQAERWVWPTVRS